MRQLRINLDALATGYVPRSTLYSADVESDDYGNLSLVLSYEEE